MPAAVIAAMAAIRTPPFSAHRSSAFVMAKRVKMATVKVNITF
jgi:hypothetical protein